MTTGPVIRFPINSFSGFDRAETMSLPISPCHWWIKLKPRAPKAGSEGGLIIILVFVLKS